MEIDTCPNCEGVWFDEGEIGILFRILDIKTDESDFSRFKPVKTSEKNRPCPRCRKRMDKISLDKDHHLLLDRCPQGDGLWFDRGELSRFFQEHGVNVEASRNSVISFLGEMFQSN